MVVNVSSEQIITTDISFVAAAGFTLRTGYPSGLLLQEDSDLILDELNGEPLELEDQE